jgi:hypothetical protein
MTKKPYLNALAAGAYIAFIGLILYFGSVVKLGHNSTLAPIAFISLFTFSAAMMGYLFLYQPFVLYFDGKKKQGVNLFLQTLLIFGGIIFALFVFLFLTSIK